jgi:hypothetical protein
MAGLPYWDNSRAATNYYEPIYLNQFEVLITPPSTITLNVDLLVEHVISINGLPELAPVGTVEQSYKFAKRSYAAAAPTTTIADLEIKFTVNLNEDNNMPFLIRKAQRKLSCLLPIVSNLSQKEIQRTSGGEGGIPAGSPHWTE